MIKIQEHMTLLGRKVNDRVTGFSGVVTSVCFDLFGCIQAGVNPGVDKDGKPKDSHWFDVNRLEVDPAPAVMAAPEFDWTPEKVASGDKGAAEKPAGFKV